MRTLKRAIKAGVCGAIVVCSAVVPQRVFPHEYVINLSASMPVGIYRRVEGESVRGSIVGACIPDPIAALALERGYLPKGECSNGTRPVMKYVAAIGGDTVEVTPTAVIINGRTIPNTQTLAADAYGRPVPNRLGQHSLKTGEYWLLSNYTVGSFDSRYFGPVTRVIDVVTPSVIVTRGGSHE